MDLGSGMGECVTALWPILGVSLPPLSIIVCLLSLRFVSRAAGKVRQVLHSLGSCMKTLFPF